MAKTVSRKIPRGEATELKPELFKPQESKLSWPLDPTTQDTLTRWLNGKLPNDEFGSVIAGRDDTLTTRTKNFLFIPTSSGAPTGTPDTHDGLVALVFDTTNNDLYVYDGGWIKVALA